MEKRVLSIIYFFPPIGGSGIQRALKFVKYMPKFGYIPVVETVKEGHNFAYDESLLKEIPNAAKIYRSNSGETLWLRNIIEKVSSLKNTSKSNVIATSNDTAKANVAQLSLKDRIFKFIELNYYIPDSKIRWYKNAVKDISTILLKEKIDCIFSTSYPYTVHLIALNAKKKTNLPWIADFRDPWVGNILMDMGQSEDRKNKEKKLEREVIKYADKVIMVTDPICKMYKERYPEYKDKFITITNGFDGDDFKQIEEIKTKKFTICYSGILTEGRTPKSLIEALEIIVRENNNLRDKIELKFIGLVIDEYKLLISNSKISDMINILPYMPHGECLKHMKGADINLLILPDKEASKGDFTGKIFDYIGCEKPILGIMPSNGVASNLIINKDIGNTYEHNDLAGIGSFIMKNYKLWEKGMPCKMNSIEKCSEFDRKNLTEQLVKQFDEICKTKN